jgi:hypothetical protein
LLILLIQEHSVKRRPDIFEEFAVGVSVALGSKPIRDSLRNLGPELGILPILDGAETVAVTR